MKEDILYRDNLISIKDDSITLKHYYFPFLISKRILFTNIEKIEIEEPGIGTGRWRIWGAQLFISWFPFDILRPIRKKIFLITYKNRRLKSGFTVKDSERVEEILKEKGLLD
jgi:hypothetical protein